MSNIKILSAVLSFMLLFAISCSNEGTTGGNGGEDNGSMGYTHSNHPPRGDYKYQNHDTNKSYSTQRAIVNIVDGNCNITGKVSDFNGGSLDYNITVTSWYTFNSYPTTNVAGSLYKRGEATISQPSSNSVDYFSVEYDTANERIMVTLKLLNVNGSYYTYYLTRD